MVTFFIYGLYTRGINSQKSSRQKVRRAILDTCVRHKSLYFALNEMTFRFVAEHEATDSVHIVAQVFDSIDGVHENRTVIATDICRAVRSQVDMPVSCKVGLFDLSFDGFAQA